MKKFTLLIFIVFNMGCATSTVSVSDLKNCEIQCGSLEKIKNLDLIEGKACCICK